MSHTQGSGEPKKYRVLFYHAGLKKRAWIYTAALQMKTYIDILHPDLASQIDWLLPIQQLISNDELVAYCHKHSVDALCTSHYIWNHSILCDQLAAIKSNLLPHTQIIAGGPSIDVNINTNFLQQHSYIDFAVYSAGEKAFADILYNLVLHRPLTAVTTSNCAWRNVKTNQAVLAPYQFVKMLETSPFLHNGGMFAAMTQQLTAVNDNVWLPYTLTRGCPYTCTFCDWNSGLGNKVSRRKHTYQQEIDLFHQVGITNIYLSDANVGQYDEDVDMIQYFADKNSHHGARFHIGGNYSKLNKKNNLKIYHILAKNNLVKKTLNFSIQDTNPKVLDLINRPDVGWDTHLAMANELRTAYPNLVIKAQLIYGLPGQTARSWQRTLQTVVDSKIYPVVFVNEPLPASPALYDPNYQDQFAFEYVSSTRFDDDRKWRSLIPKRSVFFDAEHMVEMNLLSAIYSAMSLINFAMIDNQFDTFDVATVVDDFLSSANYKSLHGNLLNNWIQHSNYYYTVGYDGEPALVDDVSIGWHILNHAKFAKNLLRFLPAHKHKDFIRLFANEKIKKYTFDVLSDVD